MHEQKPEFKSFVMAGFECTSALGEERKRFDLLGASKHDTLCRNDYRNIKEMGIKTVREGLSWHHIDQGENVYNFDRFEPMMKIGKEEGIQQIWDLNHFDYPEYLNPLEPEFIKQFAEYAKRVLEKLRKYSSDTLYIVPMNEISFFSWIGGEKGWWAPYLKENEETNHFKKQLVSAAIEAIKALWKEDPNIRFIHVDPFMRRVAKEPANELAREQAKCFNEVFRYEAWDMIAGKLNPELGGHSKYLDIIGVNYYFHNQEWLTSPDEKTIKYETMEWDSSGRISFSEILNEIHERYQKPIVISETGSYGNLRVKWWSRIFKEIDHALKNGLPIYGICAYPTLDRPEGAGFLLPHSGLWDFDMADETCKRIPYKPALNIIKRYIKKRENFTFLKNEPITLLPLRQLRPQKLRKTSLTVNFNH